MDPTGVDTWWRLQYFANSECYMKLCDGNLAMTVGGYPENASPNRWKGQGVGLTYGTAGEMCGGDDYLWLSDPNSANTQGIGDSLLSSKDMPGLSGPSLRARTLEWYENWTNGVLTLQSSQYDASTQFLLLVIPQWDTDSSDASSYDGQDTGGLNRAKLFITRNKADFNYDGTVSSADLLDLSATYGKTSGETGYNPDCDLDGNGQVGSSDLLDLSARYGTDCSFAQ
jgi:hypothetical protein